MGSAFVDDNRATFNGPGNELEGGFVRSTCYHNINAFEDFGAKLHDGMFLATKFDFLTSRAFSGDELDDVGVDKVALGSEGFEISVLFASQGSEASREVPAGFVFWHIELFSW